MNAEDLTDGLTGCHSRQALILDLHQAVTEADRMSRRYRATFLCVDLDNLQRYLDQHGHAPTDILLQRLADRLCILYPNSRVYRFGGDEFVVEKVDQPDLDLNSHFEVPVKQALVDIDVGLQGKRINRTASWIMLHIHEGVVKSSVQPIRIECRDRPAADRKYMGST